MGSAIQSIHLPITTGSQEKINIQKEKNNAFEDVYNATIQLLEQTNQAELQADQKSLEFAMGKTDSIEDVMIAQEKANLLLQFTIQVRNKVVESYKEIMRMPL